MAEPLVPSFPGLEAERDAELGNVLLPESEDLSWAYLTRKGNLTNLQRVCREARRYEFAEQFEDLIEKGISKDIADPSSVPIGLNEISSRLYSNPPGFRTVREVCHAINAIVRFTVEQHGADSQQAAAAFGMVARGALWYGKFAGKVHRLNDPETPYCAACGHHRAWTGNSVMKCVSCPMILHMRCHGLPSGASLRSTFTCNTCKGLPSELDRVFVKPESAASKSLAVRTSACLDEPTLSSDVRGRRKAAVAASSAVSRVAGAVAAGSDGDDDLDDDDDSISDGEDDDSSVGKASRARMSAKSAGGPVHRSAQAAAPPCTRAEMSEAMRAGPHEQWLPPDDAIGAAYGSASAVTGEAAASSGASSSSSTTCCSYDPVLLSLRRCAELSTSFSLYQRANVAVSPEALRAKAVAKRLQHASTGAELEAAPTCPGGLLVDEFEQLALNDGQIASAVLIEAERLVLARASNGWSLSPAAPRSSSSTTLSADDEWCRAVEAQPELLMAEAWTRVIATMAAADPDFLARFDARLRAIPGLAHPKAASAAAAKEKEKGIAVDAEAQSEEGGGRESELDADGIGSTNGDEDVHAVASATSGGNSLQQLHAGPGTAQLPVWALPVAHQRLCQAATNPKIVLRTDKLAKFHAEEDAALVLGFQEAAAVGAFYHARVHSHRWCLYRACLLCRRFRVRACKLVTRELTRERCKHTGKTFKKHHVIIGADFRAVRLHDAIRVLHGPAALERLKQRMDRGLFGIPVKDLPLVIQGKSTISPAGFQVMKTVIATLLGRRVRPAAKLPRPPDAIPSNASAAASLSAASQDEQVPGVSPQARFEFRSQIQQAMSSILPGPGWLERLTTAVHPLAKDVEEQVLSSLRGGCSKPAEKEPSNEKASATAMQFNPWAGLLLAECDSQRTQTAFNPRDTSMLSQADVQVYLQPPKQVSKSLCLVPIPAGIKPAMGLPASADVSIGDVAAHQRFGLAALQLALTTGCITPNVAAAAECAFTGLRGLAVLLATAIIRPVHEATPAKLREILGTVAPTAAAALAADPEAGNHLERCVLRAWEAAAVAGGMMDAEQDAVDEALRSLDTQPPGPASTGSPWAVPGPRAPRRLKLLRRPTGDAAVGRAGSDCTCGGVWTAPLVAGAPAKGVDCGGGSKSASGAACATLRTTAIPILRTAASELLDAKEGQMTGHSTAPSASWVLGDGGDVAAAVWRGLKRRMVGVVAMVRVLLSHSPSAHTQACRSAVPTIASATAKDPAFGAENYTGFFRALAWGDLIDPSCLMDAITARNAGAGGEGFATNMRVAYSAPPVLLETILAGRTEEALQEQMLRMSSNHVASTTLQQPPMQPVTRETGSHHPKRYRDNAQAREAQAPPSKRQPVEGSSEEDTTSTERQHRKCRVIIKFGVAPPQSGPACATASPAPASELAGVAAVHEDVDI